MDTAIPEEVITNKKRKTAVYVVLAALLLLLAVWAMRTTLKNSVKRSAIITSVVEYGNIENTINASGEVLPEFEEIITSPINASISAVMADAGSKVSAGQPILQLDKTASENDLAKLKFQLETKRADIKKLGLELDKSFYDIKSNNDIKQLKITSLEAEIENAKRLYKAGGGTKESIDQAEMNLQVAQLEKLQLENEIRNKQQTMKVEMKEAEIAADIQENEQRELERKLRLANMVASRAGVITYINKNIGSTVREGDAVARIADLSSFKVSGTISANYIDQLHSGMDAIVRINDVSVRGVVSQVYPSVQNNLVSFEITLNKQANPLLRPNMKVEVYLITASHQHVLRVTNGPAFKGSSEQDVFVVENNKAVKRTVHIGMASFDYVELKDNVQKGDVIITSDMSGFKNADEVSINE
ncbi:MAG TPA: HlyD family efflux transporter periplasmic adaptor subunit [Puia sp.]|nr:HlyD family efflux transporter periplasmic adaptor subunit [Puia sp.]